MHYKHMIIMINLLYQLISLIIIFTYYEYAQEIIIWTYTFFFDKWTYTYINIFSGG
jgi:hypothetical protein